MEEKEITGIIKLGMNEKVKIFRDNVGFTCDSGLTEFVNSAEHTVTRIKPTIKVIDGRLMTHYIVVYTD